MDFLNRMGIGKRLYVISVVLIAALGGVSAAAWFQLHAVTRLADQTGASRMPQLQRVADVELNVTRVSLQIRHAMLVKTPADLGATLADIGEKRKHIDEAFQAYDKAIFTPAGREAFAVFPPLAREFWDIGTANIKLIEAGQADAAFAMLVEKTIPVRNRLLAALDKEKKRQSDALAADLFTIEKESASTLAQLLALVAAVAVGLLAFAFYIAAALKGRVAQVQAVAEAVRDGNLSQAVNDNARDEFSPLLASMRDMQESLARVVSTVRQNSENVASASAQIAQGNQDLSGRTEEQASALEETAASMEELGSTVRQNADNAKQANQLALGASTVAVKGGEVVGQVVTTMKGINDSSKRIADIISVIDSIAFQTNILALNAAVEAARAGEQGRGFAVVASEVRSLAQRSADAAKEIKTLITVSVERVEQGTSLVDQAGATMQEIVTSIRRVTDIMGEISSASTEQSAGVAQVGEAITQMDQATQQNAALVEQSAAAAESLKGQAAQLVQAVAIFKLGEAHRRVDPAPSSALPTGAPKAPAVPERRGPNRAKNVTRPVFGAGKAKPAPSAGVQGAAAPSPPAKTGTDDNWQTF